MRSIGKITMQKKMCIRDRHDIMFAGRDEVITFTHTAYSREIFAKGAVEAAKFLAGKPAGLYDMADVVG